MKQVCFKCAHCNSGEVNDTVDGKEVTTFECSLKGETILLDFNKDCEGFKPEEYLNIPQSVLPIQDRYEDDLSVTEPLENTVNYAFENVFILTRITLKIGAKRVNEILKNIEQKIYLEESL